MTPRRPRARKPRPATGVGFSTFASNARWALSLLWSTDKLQLLGVVATVGLQSLLPAAQALASRGLINAVVATLKPSAPVDDTLWLWFGVGLGLAVVQATVGLANNLWSQLLSGKLEVRLTTDILSHAAHLDLSFFEDPRYQDTFERAQQNPSAHIFAFVDSALSSASNITQAASLIGILLVLEPWTAVVLIPIVLPYLISQWRLAKTKYDLQYARATKRRWTRYFIGRLTNRGSIPEVKLLDLAPLLIANYRALAEEFRTQDDRLLFRRFWGAAVFVVVSLGGLYFLFARVISRVIAGALTLGDIGLYGGALLRLRNALDSAVSSLSSAIAETLFAADLAEFLKTEPRIVPTGGLTPGAARGEIRVEQLSFAYPGSSQPVLKDLDLHIRPGETVALVGENGAGKTTLVKLLARLYEPDLGRILLDGHDLRDLSLPYLYAQIAFIFQDFNRYEATAADNIAYGDWRNLLQDRPAVEAAARRADAHDMVASFPQGYDTLLGRMFGQHDLSGGQWQKLAIARVAARPASLLILDEPTSNLDARAEYELFCRFRELAQGRTTILISHRFTTVSMADRILVMAGGCIVEQGTHRELLDRAGAYAALYNYHRLQSDTP
jgi:ATP-binding cassette, subfamily B, bacterial